MSRRDAILIEMGLGPVWRSRNPAPLTREVAAPVAVPPPLVPVPEPAVIEVLVTANADVHSGISTPTHPSSPASSAPDLDWLGLERTVAECRACGLCEARKQAVLGVGDRQADWLFVGEGPGAEEDECGEPFVGQAGKLLDNMLAAIDLQRQKDVYIANAVKCRPPGNRTPDRSEITTCHPYLARQIELIKPRLIVALGRPAAQSLLNTEIKIAAMRGKLHQYQGIPLLITYHPAYLLRNLPDKMKAWEDLLLAWQTMKQLKLQTED